ncbi:MAG: hypothetical protein FD180_1818 [Planctomycetota bacterium]|nr:MAG: hypothetical protein FD180_1818 [Planctomycetota bacterium]
MKSPSSSQVVVAAVVFGVGCLAGSLLPRREASAEPRPGKVGSYALCQGEFRDGSTGETKMVGFFRINTETGETWMYQDVPTSAYREKGAVSNWGEPISETVFPTKK